MQSIFRKRSPAVVTTTDRQRIVDYGRYLPKKPRKRALLSYLVGPVADELAGTKLTRFSNHGIAASWARVLNELGYIVDIIDWDDTSFSPTRDYDLVIFHGGKNYDTIYSHLAKKPPIIYFATGTYWQFNNSAENARLNGIEKRHHIKLPRDRYVADSEDAVNMAAKGIIALGDSFIQSTYSQFRLVLGVNNASYPDDHFDKITKDYGQLRKNFLFFAGAGNVHKGLDLLLDAFDGLNAELYIVTVKESQFFEAFKAQLALPNIHWLGEVNMRTQEFYDAMDRCVFTIFPSCSEGQAGSVVEAMNQGLIPIVSQETSLNATGYGLVLSDTTIPTIRAAVQQMSHKTPAELAYLARRVREVAKTDHSPESFRQDLRQAIIKILGVD